MIGNILGSIAGKSASAIIDSIGKIIDDVSTSEEERAALKLAVEKLRQRPYELQYALNVAEANHSSAFVAGWRPALGYVCVAGIAMVYIANPILQYTGFPAVDLPLEYLMELIAGMLGLASLRTFEKVKGATK